MTNKNATNWTNITSLWENKDYEEYDKIQDICDYMTLFTLLLIMFSMGLDISLNQSFSGLLADFAAAVNEHLLSFDKRHAMDDKNSTNLTTNATSVPGLLEDDYRKMLKKISDDMAIFTLCLTMVAIGSDILFKQVWEHLKRPFGVVIGMFSQFFVMPLVGFTLLRIMDFGPGHNISVLLVSCCPGGAVSNIFAYYLDGDLSLSVTMTSMSTLLALGFMPMNLWMYGMAVNTGTLVIPFKNMAASLAYVTSPAALGMFIKWKFPKVAHYITKIGSICGFLMIAIVITVQNVAYPDILTNVPWKMYLTVVIMPIIGFTLGFTLAWVCRRKVPVRKTISVECGVQNVAIAIGVISLSPFTFQMQKTILLFPMLYGISMISLCGLICCLYQVYKRFCWKPDKTELDLIEKEKSTSSEKHSSPKEDAVFSLSNGATLRGLNEAQGYV